MKNILKYKMFEQLKFKGYEVYDLKYDAPSYVKDPKKQKEIIKNNIDKIDDDSKIYNLYINVMNNLSSDNQNIDKKIKGYIISAFNNHTRIDMAYCGHLDKEWLGYIHIELTPYGDIDDIVWNKTASKAVVFKNKKDAEEVMNKIKKGKQYYFYDFKVKEITLNQGFQF